MCCVLNIGCLLVSRHEQGGDGAADRVPAGRGEGGQAGEVGRDDGAHAGEHLRRQEPQELHHGRPRPRHARRRFPHRLRAEVHVHGGLQVVQLPVPGEGLPAGQARVRAELSLPR